MRLTPHARFGGGPTEKYRRQRRQLAGGLPYKMGQVRSAPETFSANRPGYAAKDRAMRSAHCQVAQAERLMSLMRVATE